MNKWVFLLFFTSKLFALYMGNPASPEIVDEGFFFCKENWLVVKGGYQRDWVFDRNMKAVSKLSGRIDTFNFTADQGVLMINLIDRIEFYGLAGAARFHAVHCSTKYMNHTFQTHDQVTWGIGAGGIFAAWEGASFGMNAAYQQACPIMQRITSNGVPIKLRAGTKLSYNEWQIGAGVSYQIDFFIPYIGVKYSNVTVRFKSLPAEIVSSGNHFKTKNRRKFGMVIGTTLSNGNRFGTTVETRLIDEQSITLTAAIKF